MFNRRSRMNFENRIRVRARIGKIFTWYMLICTGLVTAIVTYIVVMYIGLKILNLFH
jgi:hypothetical protein